MPERAVAAFVEAALRSDPVRADWTAIHEWAELDPAKIGVPTLLLHGEHDPYAPVRRQSAFFARIGHPDRAHVVVAGGTHAAHLEDTGPRFVHAVVSFLERP
jgi:pimeloyl-ACP methyl ester carboxylesterase